MSIDGRFEKQEVEERDRERKRQEIISELTASRAFEE